MDSLGRGTSRGQPPSTAGPRSAGAAIKNSAAIAPSLSHLRCRAFIYTAPSTSARICSPAHAAGGSDSGRGLDRWSIHFWQKPGKSKRLRPQGNARPLQRPQEQIRYGAAGLAGSSARCATAAVATELSPCRPRPAFFAVHSGERLLLPCGLPCKRRPDRLSNLRAGTARRHQPSLSKKIRRPNRGVRFARTLRWRKRDSNPRSPNRDSKTR
jgi:hypothetical protein